MQRPVSTPSFPVFADEEGAEDLEAKPEKAPAVRPSAATERSVHLVPLIVVLCFVVVLLCSHVPSPSDMSSFGGNAGGRKAQAALTRTKEGDDRDSSRQGLSQ
ncbi:hypothetical protein CFC21_025260 [Triticum aestivum]|uniref:Transmembrane protein n=2 Tax=Triticum aestivum TaxID=4565 RepID=A0A3B6CCF8_WHEAT|nr:hypothetical protein CFC21_025260 [Triticum aestivum]